MKHMEYVKHMKNMKQNKYMKHMKYMDHMKYMKSVDILALGEQLDGLVGHLLAHLNIDYSECILAVSN